MPVIQPDTSEMEDLSPINPGTYQAEIISTDVQNSKEKGNPMCVPTFKVAVPDREKPATRKAYLPISGAGSFNFDQLLRAAGFQAEADEIKSGAKRPFDTDVLVGKRVNVVITENLYNGQKRDQISSYLPA